MNFIGTLARIAGNAAKLVYAVIYECPNEVATLKDIQAAGIGRTTAHEALLELQLAGFIIKVSGGVYRTNTPSGNESSMLYKAFPPQKDPTPDSAPPEHESAPPDSTESLTESAPPDSCTPKSPPRRTRKPKAESAPPEHESAPPEHESAPPESDPKPVNVVNNLTCVNKLTATDEIEKHIDHLEKTDKEAHDRYLKKCHAIEKMLDERNLSRDVIVRIVASEMFLEKPITLELLDNWKKEAIAAQLKGNVKHRWMAIANNVKIFYEKQGVKWTKCRPNNVRNTANELKSIGNIVPNLLQKAHNGGLTIRTPNGEQSLGEFLSGKEISPLKHPPKMRTQ
jgi:DNA-binding FrmR family transcriptional regulator